MPFSLHIIYLCCKYNFFLESEGILVSQTHLHDFPILACLTLVPRLSKSGKRTGVEVYTVGSLVLKLLNFLSPVELLLDPSFCRSILIFPLGVHNFLQ